MSKGWAESLAEHLKVSDADCPICFECGEMYELRHGSDDTGFCDSCAQAMVSDALRYREAEELRHAQNSNVEKP